jgi:hypothetical protein
MAKTNEMKFCQPCEHWVHNGIDLVCSTCGRPKSHASEKPEINFTTTEEEEFSKKYKEEIMEHRYQEWKISEGIKDSNVSSSKKPKVKETIEAAPTPDSLIQKIGIPYSADKESRAKVARQSANLVNSFGTVLQILAAIASISILALATWTSKELYGSYIPGFVGGLIVSSILLFIYASVGALYRMIANYILYKTTN